MKHTSPLPDPGLDSSTGPSAQGLHPEIETDRSSAQDKSPEKWTRAITVVVENLSKNMDELGEALIFESAAGYHRSISYKEFMAARVALRKLITAVRKRNRLYAATKQPAK